MPFAAGADTVVVTADHMIDVLKRQGHRQALHHTSPDGRISAVGSQGGPSSTSARHVDLPGMTLLPGLIDMHVHLTADPRYGGYRGLEFTRQFLDRRGGCECKKKNPRGRLYHGAQCRLGRLC